ncbi:hypothetical protein E2C01_070319 [Portunus trituberculatus]|uniref:Uncharacterized protein n=1 Tax=Portunus trituberculatus TaxID=210409 RepID=A0A5B7I1Y4_PORTR|nr:hypothetical protein [Portunus trituberculatus]
MSYIITKNRPQRSSSSKIVGPSTGATAALPNCGGGAVPACPTTGSATHQEASARLSFDLHLANTGILAISLLIMVVEMESAEYRRLAAGGLKQQQCALRTRGR